MLSMIRRAEIAQAAIDQFSGRALVYGEADCLQLLAGVVEAAGWPDPRAGLRYRTPKAALLTLKRLGFTDLADAVDKRLGLTRIPLAWHLPADILWFPSDDGMGALGVAVGNGKALAFVDASLNPQTMRRIKRRVAGLEHRLRAARAAGERLGWPAEYLSARMAPIEAKRSSLLAVANWGDAPPVRAIVGAATAAVICWRLELCPR